MSRRILQGRRVRAIAAVHALIGATVAVCSIALVGISASHSHGPSDLGAAAVPIIGGLGFVGGAILVVIACLLWMYKPIAKWATGALFACASAMCAYLFLKYDVDFIIKEGTARIRGADSSLLHYVCGALIEILIVAWSAVVLVALFRRDSRDVFSSEFRESIRADRAVRIPFYSSPYFVTGVLVWLIIGWAVSVL
jgi:hypothetical protein